jgi:hypothetical protein
MKRAAQLLLLLLTAWLLTTTARLPTAPHVGPPVASSEERARPGVEHVAAESATPQVPKAPLLSREPVAVMLPARGSSFERSCETEIRDLRASLVRVQTRRRLPRLEVGEPPWC